MKLAELASKSDSTSRLKALKLQKTLALKKDFRMVAVQRVLSNKGGNTMGIDNILIKSDHEKWDTIE